MNALLWMLFLIGGVITASLSPSKSPEESTVIEEDSLWQKIVPNTWLPTPQMQWSIKPLNNVQPLTKESLVKLWDQYKQDCWNDSTEKFDWILYNATEEDSIRLRKWDVGVGQLISHRQTSWVHKHEPDSPGFIEWLRKGKL